MLLFAHTYIERIAYGVQMRDILKVHHSFHLSWKPGCHFIHWKMPIVSYTKCGCVEFSTKVLLRVIQLNVIFRHLTSQKLPGIWTCMKMSKNVFYLLLQGWDTILSSCQDYYRVFLASAPVNCKLIDKWSSNPQKSLYLSRIWGKQFILNPQHTEQ